MVQVRKLVLAIAAATALSSGMAQALELGELTLKSAANQPLVAEIELRDVAQLTAPEIVPGLASPEEFARAGLDRQAFLNQLNFTPVINPGGRSVIQVTSPAPLPEPLLKFLVQVIYPSGRLMRDYSVLVDPSRFSPQAAEAAAPPATPAVTAPASANAREYTTTNRDTLWEIAARFREQASVQQTMLAIQAMNPDAFQDANINRLRAGQVLRLPDNSDATALPQPKAIAEVARQNAAWREGRRLGPRAQQLDATRGNGRGNAPAPAQGDNLKLVSGEAANERARGLAGDNKVLSDKLAVTQESLDSARRENGELQSRMADLQSQLEKAQRLLQLKSDQLARLEAAASGTPASDAAEPGAVPEGTAPADGQPAINAQLTPPPENQEAPAEGSATPAPAPAPAANDPAAVPPVVAEPVAEEAPSNPWVLGSAAGLAIAAVLLAAWLLARRRKAQQESERHARMARELSEAQEFRSEDFDLPSTSFEGLGTPSPSVRLTPAMVAASAAAAQAAEAPVYQRPSSPPPKNELPTVASLVVAPAADDALTQADDQIAQGRYTRASDILEAAIEAEPDRSDLRLKLMEVFAHQGDRDGFVAQERRLMATGANHARVNELKARFPAMAGVAAGLSAAAVAAELDAQYVKDLLQDEPNAPEPIGDVFDTDFDLSLDGIETAPEEPAPAVEQAPARAVPRDELDFESLLRERTALQASEASPAEPEVAPDEPAPSLEDELHEVDPLDIEPVPEEAPDDAAVLSDHERLEDFDLSLSDDQKEDQDRFAADVNDVNSQLDELSRSLSEASAGNSLHSAQGADEGLDEFDFLADSDEVTTKLDLARAYIEMSDAEGARDILDEVLKEGNVAQQKEARKMLAALS